MMNKTNDISITQQWEIATNTKLPIGGGEKLSILDYGGPVTIILAIGVLNTVQLKYLIKLIKALGNNSKN